LNGLLMYMNMFPCVFVVKKECMKRRFRVAQ
jgi:hypothetical protein